MPATHILHEMTLHRIVQPSRDDSTLTMMIQSAPMYEDNHMLSFPHITSPDLCAETIGSTAYLRVILEEILEALHVQVQREKLTTELSALSK